MSESNAQLKPAETNNETKTALAAKFKVAMSAPFKHYVVSLVGVTLGALSTLGVLWYRNKK